MVKANSKEEFVKWAHRCPADPGDVIEIRQIFDAADFAIKKWEAVLEYRCRSFTTKQQQLRPGAVRDCGCQSKAAR
jgi:hypothetical protein